MDMDGARLVGETGAIDPTGIRFAGDELIEHQAVGRELVRRFA